MNFIKSLLSLLALCFLLTSSVLASDFQAHPDARILGISKLTSEEVILKSLGQPTKVIEGPTFMDPAYGYQKRFKKIYYKGTIFVMEEWTDNRLPKKRSSVTMMHLTDRSATTARGLAVGDSEARVKELYGDSYYESSATQALGGLSLTKIKHDKAYAYHLPSQEVLLICITKGQVVLIQLS